MPEAMVATRPVPDASSERLLSVAELRVHYGAVAAIKGVSLHVGPGEVVALLGANGAGKTTMLRTISGLIRPRSGAIHLRRHADRPHAAVADRAARHRPLAGRPPHLRLAQRRGESAARRRRAGRPLGIDEDRERIYTLFPILRERMHQQAGTLSGGEQQMLALGRALMAGPKLLLLDEPSLGLAPLIIQPIFRTLADLKRSGVDHAARRAEHLGRARPRRPRLCAPHRRNRALRPARELSANYEEVASAYLGARA